MILYIAEKPSLGRAIAAVLPQPQQRGDGYIRLGNGDCVSWCIGHLLEPAEPEAYDPALKQWRLEALPILPDPWRLTPRPSSRKQLAVLRKLVKQADQLVHAGDPDREGQLLVDEVIDYLQVPAAKRQQVQRCLINDLNPAAVRRALERLRPNREFIPLSVSALARSRADWLYGINLTRAFTLQGRKVGYNGVLSVGRVQTPLLGLVVRRDRDIEGFQSRPFYNVWAELETASGERFRARWQPSEACQPYQDEEGRVLHRPLAERVVARILRQPATVSGVVQQPKRQAPPLPFNLSALQIEAARKHGLSAQQVLDGCQILYERHQLITYPRSDSRYLPSEQHGDAATVLAAIAATATELQTGVAGADPSRRSKAWNDAKVDAHHALIPTAKRASLEALGAREQQLYRLIARQYLLQFYPDYTYQHTRVAVSISGGCFIASARQPQQQGWRALEGIGADSQRETATADNDTEVAALPPLQEGQALHCVDATLQEQQTQPPKPFNDATLLAAMTGIARYVSDPAVRKVLRDSDGLGTEATRAGIIELLFKRGFLSRQGKQIRSTEAGRGLIDSLPPSATVPDMTARWESTLEAISQRQARYQDFMHGLQGALTQLLQEARSNLPLALKGVTAPTRSSRSRLRRKRQRAA
ncbi:MAG TPA: DNA topoisomerase III [Motiliproteus sp.]